MPALANWQHHLTSNVSADEKLEVPEDFIILEPCDQCGNFRYPLGRFCPAEGHGFCEECVSTMCYKCKNVAVQLLRIRSGREVDGKMVFPCWYEFLGCPVAEEDMDVPHEEECSYGKIDCPYQHCKDPTVTKKSLPRHLYFMHRFGFPVPAELVPVDIFFMHKETSAVFVFTITEDEGNKMYRFSVNIVASNPEYNNKYTYKMKVYPLPAGERDMLMPEKQFEAKIELYSKGHFVKDDNPNTLNIPFDEAKHYYNREYRRFRVVLEQITRIAVDAEAAGDEAAGNEAAGNEAAESEDSENEAAGNEDAGNEAAGNEAAGNEAAGNEAAGNEAAGNEAAGNEAAGNEAAGNEAPGIEAAAGNEAAGKEAAAN